jgi:hypothetical protein
LLKVGNKVKIYMMKIVKNMEKDLRCLMKQFWIEIGIGEKKILLIHLVEINNNLDILAHIAWMHYLWLFILFISQKVSSKSPFGTLIWVETATQ